MGILYIIKCDKCGRQGGVPGDSRLGLARFLRPLGWTVQLTPVEVVCPECKKKG